MFKGVSDEEIKERLEPARAVAKPTLTSMYMDALSVAAPILGLPMSIGKAANIARPRTSTVKEAFGSHVASIYKGGLANRATNLNKDFYPTSKHVAKRMIDWVSDKGKRALGNILEPHAGEGHLVREIEKQTGHLPVTLEIDPKRVAALQKKGIPAKEGDFLNYAGKHDTIIMNPPFSKGQAKIHILKAMDNLTETGKGVSLVSSQDAMTGRPLRRWIESSPNVELLGFTNMPNQNIKGKSKTVGIVGFTKPK